jgi:hypothetical protein
MSGLPTVTVELDDVDNGGTWPYDISAYVNIGATSGGPITISRGRTDEISAMQPSSLSLVLDNIDGRFTLGDTSGGYGAINVDRRIRVSYTVGGVTSKRFTGYVQDWPTEWVTGSDTHAVARITAQCRWANLARWNLRSQMESYAEIDDVLGYYTLGEDAGPAYNTSRYTQDPLKYTTLGAPDATFGVTTGGPVGDGGLTSVKFVGGDWLTANVTGASSAASVFTIAGYVSFTVNDTYGAYLYLINTASENPTTMLIKNDGSGHFTASITTSDNTTASVTTTGTYNDGNPHLIACTFDATAGHGTLWVDDAAGLTFGSFSGKTLDFSTATFEVGVLVANSTQSHCYYGPFVPTSTANAYALSTSGTGDTELNAQTFGQFAGISLDDMNLEASYQTTMAYVDTTGQSVTSMLELAALTEGGLAFIDGWGALTFQNRFHRTNGYTLLELTADDIDPGTRFDADSQLIINYVDGTRANGTKNLIEQSKTSIDEHGPYPYSLDGLACASDTEFQDHARWVIYTHKEPSARCGQLPVDLLTQSTTNQQNVQAAEISDRITITGMPSQTPGGTTVDLTIEGWTETLDATSWDIVFNTTPWSLNAAWILDDATLSVEGTTTIPSY